METVLNKLHGRAFLSLGREKPGTSPDPHHDLSNLDAAVENMDEEGANTVAEIECDPKNTTTNTEEGDAGCAVSSGNVENQKPEICPSAETAYPCITDTENITRPTQMPDALEPDKEVPTTLVDEPKSSVDEKLIQESTDKISRSSRRKPQKTQRVLESEELDDVVYRQYLDDDDLFDYLMSSTTTLCNSQPSSPCVGSDADEVGSTDKNGNSEFDEENLVLPEGTVFVNPESADASPQILEIDSSRSKKIFRGNLDSAIIHCTACNKQIGLDGFLDIHRHPVLKVLICRKCYSLYNDLEIEQDAEGSDEQCRWCGQGGDLICCDFCHNALCKGCIRRNLGRKELGSILSADEGVKWKCYVCDPKPLLNLIEHCTSIMEALTKQEKKQQELENRRRKTDSRKSVANAPPSTAEAGLLSQPVSVIRAPSVSVMGRSLLKTSQPRVEVQSRQKSYVNVVNYSQPGSKESASAKPSITILRGVPAKNGSVHTATLTGNSASRVPQPSSARAVVHANDQTMLLTLERLLSATHSMNMFLTSLKDDLRRNCGTSITFTPAQMQKRCEVASKLWQAYMSYTKAFQEATAQTHEAVRKTSSAAKPLPPANNSQNKMEVIELSDSDEESNTAAQTSRSSPTLRSRPHGVIVENSAVSSRQEENGVQLKSDHASTDVQPSTSANSSETARVGSTTGNRRKRKNPQHVVNVDEVLEKRPHLDEVTGADLNAMCLREADKGLNSVTEEAAKSVDVGSRDDVLCVEIGDDLEEVMHKIVNGRCSSVELSMKQSGSRSNGQTDSSKHSTSLSTSNRKTQENKSSEVNGHPNLD